MTNALSFARAAVQLTNVYWLTFVNPESAP